MTRARHYPRALSADELKVINSWNLLSEKEPELGQKCVYRIIADHWSGEEETGTWGNLAGSGVDGVRVLYSRNGTFISEKGWLASDAKQTYWLPFDKKENP